MYPLLTRLLWGRTNTLSALVLIIAAHALFSVYPPQIIHLFVCTCEDLLRAHIPCIACLCSHFVSPHHIVCHWHRPPYPVAVVSSPGSGPLPCRCSVLEAPWCSNMPEHQEWALLFSSGFLGSTWLKWNDGRWNWASWYTFSSSSGWAHHSPCKGLWNGRLRCSPDMWAGL